MIRSRAQGLDGWCNEWIRCYSVRNHEPTPDRTSSDSAVHHQTIKHQMRQHLSEVGWPRVESIPQPRPASPLLSSQAEENNIMLMSIKMLISGLCLDTNSPTPFEGCILNCLNVFSVWKETKPRGKWNKFTDSSLIWPTANTKESLKNALKVQFISSHHNFWRVESNQLAATGDYWATHSGISSFFFSRLQLHSEAWYFQHCCPKWRGAGCQSWCHIIQRMLHWSQTLGLACCCHLDHLIPWIYALKPPKLWYEPHHIHLGSTSSVKTTKSLPVTERTRDVTADRFLYF